MLSYSRTCISAGQLEVLYISNSNAYAVFRIRLCIYIPLDTFSMSSLLLQIFDFVDRISGIQGSIGVSESNLLLLLFYVSRLF
jgi:hypothetical protein